MMTNRRTPYQQQVLTKFRAAMTRYTEEHIPPEQLGALTCAQLDDIFAAALAALTPHDVAVFWLMPNAYVAPAPKPTATIIMLPFMQHEHRDGDHADSTMPSADVVPIRR